ncbi:DUF3182 family protein [Mesorhizobium sp. B2-1-3]|nr:DUF3182 family protein [Mesorhizobium sp. B2-1-3]
MISNFCRACSPKVWIIGTSAASLAGPKDFFGGVLPTRLAMTKVITHGVTGASVFRPGDWPAEFAERISAAVLPGYNTFSRADTLRAADCRPQPTLPCIFSERIPTRVPSRATRRLRGNPFSDDQGSD